MGKIIDIWTGRELPPNEPQPSYRINQATRTQLCQFAGFSEALGLLTPDDLLQVIREHRPEEPDLHCHPFELTSEQAYRVVAILRESTRQAGTFGKGRRRAADFINHGAPDEWLRPHGYNSRVPKLRKRARARTGTRRSIQYDISIFRAGDAGKSPNQIIQEFNEWTQGHREENARRARRRGAGDAADRTGPGKSSRMGREPHGEDAPDGAGRGD